MTNGIYIPLATSTSATPQQQIALALSVAKGNDASVIAVIQGAAIEVSPTDDVGSIKARLEIYSANPHRASILDSVKSVLDKRKVWLRQKGESDYEERGFVSAITLSRGEELVLIEIGIEKAVGK